MDKALFILSISLISLDVLLCQDIKLICPETGTPIDTCQDECEASQTLTCANGELCCLVKCGYQCINPEEYNVDGPEFKSHYPNYGPVSGGTVIVLTGNFTSIKYISSAFLKSIPQDPSTGVRGINSDVTIKLDVISRNFTHILLGSTYQDDLYIGLTFLIHLNYETNYVWSTTTDFEFTYRPDPTITGLYPRTAFISGGIALTAVGENLNSVANPVMLIHMERRRNVNTKQFIVIGGYTFRSEDTHVYNSTAVVGITPLINTSATDDFNSGLNPDGDPIPQTRRRRQTEATGAPDIPINSDTLEFFVGFELDGVTRFENLSQAIDAETGRLVVYQTPHIEQYQNIKRYNPKTENQLVIKGERLTLGAKQSDYHISLGSEPCEVVDLSDNAVLCAPPEVEPKSSSGQHDLHVFIGFFSFKVGTVEYVKDNTHIYIIIGCVVGGMVLLALIMGIAVLCCRKGGSANKGRSK